MQLRRGGSSGEEGLHDGNGLVPRRKVDMSSETLGGDPHEVGKYG